MTVYIEKVKDRIKIIYFLITIEDTVPKIDATLCHFCMYATILRPRKPDYVKRVG
jgi:hypothetical protein